MLKIRHLILTLIALVAVTPNLSGADLDDKIRFKNFVDASHISTSGMNLWIEVENDSCHKIVILSGETDIYIGESCVMTISLRDKVVIPRRGTHRVLIPMRFKSRSSMIPMRILRGIAQGEDMGISISYRIRGGTPLFKRNFERQRVPLEALWREFNITDSHKTNLLELL